MNALNILITGATIGGIGFEAARELASLGHKLYITCRSLERASAAAHAITDQIGKLKPVPLALDLSESQSIDSFLKEINRQQVSLDILINNAGVLKRGPLFSNSGQELIWAVNFIGTRELTEKMLPHLRDGGRIINVTSSVAAFGKAHRKGQTHGFRAYCDSKHALNLYNIDLARRLSERKITVNAVHPGNIITNIWRDLWPESKSLEILIKQIDKTGIISAERGARTIIYLAISLQVQGQTGGYYVRCRKKNWPANSKAEYEPSSVISI